LCWCFYFYFSITVNSDSFLVNCCHKKKWF
jgi:hypothetical protein